VWWGIQARAVACSAPWRTKYSRPNVNVQMYVNVRAVFGPCRQTYHNAK